MAQIPNQFQNRLLNSGILERDTRLGNLLSEQGGSNYATIPILDRLRGNYVNYNGSTKITDNSQKTYSQSVIAIGRAVSFNEKDFAEDITTEDFMKKYIDSISWILGRSISNRAIRSFRGYICR